MTTFPAIEERVELIQSLANCADVIERTRVQCALPMIAADLDFQRFWLASDVRMRHGLHIVTYYVIEKSSGVPFGFGETKGEAIRSFRRALRQLGHNFDPLCLLIMDERKRRHDALEKFRPAVDHNVVDIKGVASKQKRVPRRRREVFEKSKGHCHYCNEPLDLTGLWHVEHMIPKALDGSGDMSNLVAACPTCNLSKRDLTADEFIARLAVRSAS